MSVKEAKPSLEVQAQRRQALHPPHRRAALAPQTSQSQPLWVEFQSWLAFYKLSCKLYSCQMGAVCRDFLLALRIIGC